MKYSDLKKVKTPKILVEAMNAETDPNINAIFNNEVFGAEPLTVRELIIMNLQ